ncbi:MAG TPA: DUF5004 domain-containing protein [Mucilaginibacter sp.]
MKIKHLILPLIILVTGLVINSCKKENTNNIQALLVGKWQLASVQATYYTGNSMDSTTLLNTTCDSNQVFTFKADNTCTYTNFHCLAQPVASGQWALTENKLFLQSNMVCKDTTAAGTSKPFSYAQIFNLGQFSLVLNTGDIQPNYSLTAKRIIIQYGFINQKSLGIPQ